MFAPSDLESTSIDSQASVVDLSVEGQRRGRVGEGDKLLSVMS